ncbi:hypothetical protein [Amycolatopsis sp. PS_44_ISF1]|uniref:hypothetical protein n=1 Tax=Amycolatopsis sp. PS_44_ISF1 TaxID=2974917 RepID=UPI0028DF0888|nr:hypothetical protein [Amycolatopsis sp. PS_44_ISF1]MDT8910531.1 hypothetical protein [Amycolatopsis sp. PS_44_ISF1]
MWVDESGGTDTDAAGTEAMTVHVDGQEYQAEVNYDVDQDGVSDTAIVEHADGTAQDFVDTDHDGTADHYAVLDSTGHVVDQAVYDEASGAWVESGEGHPGGTGAPGQDDSTGGHIHADLPGGEVDAGVATVDTDHDGHNDTAVVETKSGGTVAFTDSDGDGEADIAVQIDADGTTHTFDHTGAGQWTEAGSGAGSADPAGDQAWGGDGTQLLNGVAKIDSGTGQWISPN